MLRDYSEERGNGNELKFEIIPVTYLRIMHISRNNTIKSFNSFISVYFNLIQTHVER